MKTIKASPTVPAQRATASLRVTISEFKGQFVTHIQNMDTLGKCHGHYFNNLDGAENSFNNRTASIQQNRCL